MKTSNAMDHGGGQVVCLLAFFSDNPSLNLAEVYSFYVEFVFGKNENKQEWPAFAI